MDEQPFSNIAIKMDDSCYYFEFVALYHAHLICHIHQDTIIFLVVP